MQARYHRDRHRLYAARVGGSRPTSLSKLAELRRARELAEGSFRRAEAEDRKRSPSRASVERGEDFSRDSAGRRVSRKRP